MGVGLGGCGAGGDRSLNDNGVCAEAAGKNCGVCHREANIQTVYRRREGGGIQKVPQMVGPIPWTHTGGEGVG